MILNKEEAPTIFTHPFMDFIKNNDLLSNFSKVYTHDMENIIGQALNNFGERTLGVELLWGDPKDVRDMAFVPAEWREEE